MGVEKEKEEGHCTAAASKCNGMIRGRQTRTLEPLLAWKAHNIDMGERRPTTTANLFSDARGQRAAEQEHSTVFLLLGRQRKADPLH